MDFSAVLQLFPCTKHRRSNHSSTRKARNRGFSLPEILVILSIIGLLSALGFNYFSRARAAARQAQCDLNFKSLLVGMNQFHADLGTMPLDITEMSDAGYVKDPSALRCPSHPLQTANYDDFYIARNNRDMADRPLVVCPFHEKMSGQGLQAYSNMQTHHHGLLPAIIRSAANATVETPGEEPRMAKKGVEVHGGDVLRTSNGGSATLIFADGSASTLSRNSALLVLQTFVPARPAPYYTLVRHLLGDITYDVNDGSHFEVATPSSVVGAYGTQFRIIVDNTGEGDVWALKNSIYVSGPEDFAVLVSNTPNSARHLPRKRRRHGNGNGNNGNGNGNGGNNGNNGGNNGGGNGNGGNGNGNNGNGGNGNGGNPNGF